MTRQSISDRLSILGVVASPHGSGTTLAAVAAVLEGCRESGAETELVDLAAEPGTRTMIDKVESFDAVVFGSPTYRATHTSLLANLLEQIGRGAAYESGAPLRGKATAIVMTGAATEHFLATEKLRSTLAVFFAAQVLSPSLYLAPRDFGPDKALNDRATDLARLHGRALVDLAAACRSSKSLSALQPVV
jgi:FMN reductase